MVRAPQISVIDSPSFETQTKFQPYHLVFAPRCPDVFTLAVRLYLIYLKFGPKLIGLVAGLPADTRSEDVNKFFEGYGNIIDCRVMTGSSDNRKSSIAKSQHLAGFGFVEFENAKAFRPTVDSFNYPNFFLPPGR